MATNLRRLKGTKRFDPGIPFETVFTETGYWDGPRHGVANYDSKPHHFACIFDKAADDYSEVYTLVPISARIFRFEMEAWKIWDRWDTAFHSGKTDQSTHAALPHEAERYKKLKAILDHALVAGSKKAFQKRGEFRSIRKTKSSAGAHRKFKVRWANPPAA